MRRRRLEIFDLSGKISLDVLQRNLFFPQYVFTYEQLHILISNGINWLVRTKQFISRSVPRRQKGMQFRFFNSQYCKTIVRSGGFLPGYKHGNMSPYDFPIGRLVGWGWRWMYNMLELPLRLYSRTRSVLQQLSLRTPWNDRTSKPVPWHPLCSLGTWKVQAGVGPRYEAQYLGHQDAADGDASNTNRIFFISL